MNIEEKLLIAKNVFPDKKSAIIQDSENSFEAYVCVQSYGEFNPLENDADAFKVLEALVKKQGIIREVCGISGHREGQYYIENFDDSVHHGKNLNEAICRAYLNAIEKE